jgi:hypothetical protein
MDIFENTPMVLHCRPLLDAIIAVLEHAGCGSLEKQILCQLTDFVPAIACMKENSLK